MPFVKGTPKPKGSGRKKGQICRLAADVRTKLQEMGCDPIEGLARIAAAAEEAKELAVASHCYGRLSKFCYPELKSVEHYGPGGGPITHALTSPRELLAARIAGIADRSTAGSGDSKP